MVTEVVVVVRRNLRKPVFEKVDELQLRLHHKIWGMESLPIGNTPNNATTFL